MSVSEKTKNVCKKIRNAAIYDHNEMENIKERAREVLASYEKTKSAIRKEVRKGCAREIRTFEEERAKREKIIKEKMTEIDRLEAKIESLNNTMYGFQSKNKLWEHECARISEAYHRTVMHYSNPGLVEVQLQVISEYTDALARFVGSHKWDNDTVNMAQTYCNSICEKMNHIVHKIDMNSIEDISVTSAQRNIEAGCKK